MSSSMQVIRDVLGAWEARDLAKAASYLAEGRLQRPFAADCPDRSFYVVAPPGIQERRAAMEFVRWLVRVARRHT